MQQILRFTYMYIYKQMGAIYFSFFSSRRFTYANNKKPILKQPRAKMLYQMLKSKYPSVFK